MLKSVLMNKHVKIIISQNAYLITNINTCRHRKEISNIVYFNNATQAPPTLFSTNREMLKKVNGRVPLFLRFIEKKGKKTLQRNHFSIRMNS